MKKRVTILIDMDSETAYVEHVTLITTGEGSDIENLYFTDQKGSIYGTLERLHWELGKALD